MLTVNLFGGPGCGKSTMRAGLFFNLKNSGIKVEEVTEYAKDVTYEGNTQLLSDQLYILANQNRRLTRLSDKVNVAISDAPLLLSLHYVPLEYLPNTFNALALELFNTYNNMNFFLTRMKPYAKFGRTQTEEEAKEIDVSIKSLLSKHDIPFREVPGNEDGMSRILHDILEREVA